MDSKHFKFGMLQEIPKLIKIVINRLFFSECFYLDTYHSIEKNILLFFLYLVIQNKHKKNIASINPQFYKLIGLFQVVCQ